MLGTRTKQVNAYGKRGHRIVNVSDNREGLIVGSHAMAPKCTVELCSPLRESAETFKSPPRRPKIKASVARSPLSSPEPAVKVYRRKPTSSRTQSSPKPARAELQPEQSRKPLSNVSTNVKSMRQTDETSPNVAAKKRRKPAAVVKGTPPRAKMSALKPASPVVNVEITVLDDCGKAVKQERRVSKPDVQMNPVSVKEKAPAKPVGRPKGSGKSRREAIILSDDSDDDEYVPPARARNKPLTNKGRRVIVTSDEDSEVEVLDPPRMQDLLSSPESLPALPRQPVKRKGEKIIPSSESSHGGPSEKQAKPPLPTARPSHAAFTTIRMPQQNAIHFSPLVRPDMTRRTRQLTPRRPRAIRPTFPAPPSPPSPTTPSDVDENLAFDLSQLALSPNTLGQVAHSLKTIDATNEKPPPVYLKPLLEACSQTAPHEFSAFIEMFPLDPIVQTSHGGVGLSHHPSKIKPSKTAAQFQKIGEASFSEVFGIGDVVLKVIPLRDEEAGVLVVDDDDAPAPSDVKDVLREIIVTRAMGEMCEGFVQLLRTYVVRGKYPSLLLDLWDEYDERKGSESVRPDGFGVSQLYAIIVLPNGGPDLETFVFAQDRKNGWAQACSLFWQVVRSLAEAEDMVHFEHRDLHWGQILVKIVANPGMPRVSRGRKVSMDHEVHGVRAMVIDLGLSRMETGEAEGLHFTVPDKEIFEGEGEYQFDVYRMMKTHNGGSWKPYRPLTNVMWLHYLVLKLLHEKKLRVPLAPRKTPAAPSDSPMFTERECYLGLVEVEGFLRDAVATCKPPLKKGRRQTGAVAAALAPQSLGPASANDVLEIGLGRGWIS